MTDEIQSNENPKIGNKTEHDLQNTAGYRKYWTSTQIECNWSSNSLHWHHCDKETMENMSSTLPHIQKVLISIGNTLTDSIIHNANEFQKINTILSQQKIGREHIKEKDSKGQLRKSLQEISQLGKKYNSYITQTLTDDILMELRSYNTNLINLNEKVLAQFKHLIIDTENDNLKIELRQILIKIEQLDSKDELTSLKDQILDLQNNLTNLKIQELRKLRKLVEQNQQVINMIKSVDIQKLEITVYELNKKIPDIEPLLISFEKMFKTLENIGKAIGYEE